MEPPSINDIMNTQASTGSLLSPPTPIPLLSLTAANGGGEVTAATAAAVLKSSSSAPKKAILFRTTSQNDTDSLLRQEWVSRFSYDFTI